MDNFSLHFEIWDDKVCGLSDMGNIQHTKSDRSHSMLKKVEGTRIELPRFNLIPMDVVLVGDTPLMMNKWSAKAKKQMLDKQTGKAQQKKAAKDPEEDYRESMYILEDGRFGFPVKAFKSAAITAVTSMSGVTKVGARQAFRVVGEQAIIDENLDEYAIIEGQPRKRMDPVRVGMGTADLRFRGEFYPWHTTLHILYNQNAASAEQILNMLNIAGFGVGVGEWRPEKDGQHGMFHVATKEETDEIEKTTKTRGKKKAA